VIHALRSMLNWSAYVRAPCVCPVVLVVCMDVLLIKALFAARVVWSLNGIRIVVDQFSCMH